MGGPNFSVLRRTERCVPIDTKPLVLAPTRDLSQPAPPPHNPTTAEFTLHNHDRYTLGVAFYSKTRNTAWPGNNQQYNLNPKGDQTYTLNCQPEEKICFGAWRDHQSNYWGLGHNDHGCTDCCVTCGSSREATLGDGGPDTPGPNTARFVLHNRDNQLLGVKFFSQTRSNYTWPKPGRKFSLATDDTFDLSCEKGEQICVGAWRNDGSSTWDVGHDGKHGCNDCCVICGNEKEITFNAAPESPPAQTEAPATSPPSAEESPPPPPEITTAPSGGDESTITGGNFGDGGGGPSQSQPLAPLAPPQVDENLSRHLEGDAAILRSLQRSAPPRPQSKFQLRPGPKPGVSTITGH